jgi:hypothetical protein|tara:strand:+ start:12043 stop:12183 length:141 start_codon:yes stop_codon:yes gene_type:complete
MHRELMYVAARRRATYAAEKMFLEVERVVRVLFDNLEDLQTISPCP